MSRQSILVAGLVTFTVLLLASPAFARRRAGSKASKDIPTNPTSEPDITFKKFVDCVIPWLAPSNPCKFDEGTHQRLRRAHLRGCLRLSTEQQYANTHTNAPEGYAAAGRGRIYINFKYGLWSDNPPDKWKKKGILTEEATHLYQHQHSSSFRPGGNASPALKDAYWWYREVKAKQKVMEYLQAQYDAPTTSTADKDAIYKVMEFFMGHLKTYTLKLCGAFFDHPTDSSKDGPLAGLPANNPHRKRLESCKCWGVVWFHDNNTWLSQRQRAPIPQGELPDKPTTPCN